MELDNSGVKEYFQKTNTVSKWWEPEEKPGLFRDLYVEQRRLLQGLFDPKDKTILDAGTGKGRFAIDFAERGAARVYATDLSQEMLTIAHNRAVEHGVEQVVEFQTMDVENLDYEDGFFDVVCCLETFVHLPSPLTAIRELSRVAKPGGLVVTSVTLPLRNWYVNINRVTNIDTLFEWVFTPFYQSRIYQNGIRRVIRRPPLVGRPLQAGYFRGLLEGGGLSVQKEIFLGHPKSPRFMLVTALKSSKNQA